MCSQEPSSTCKQNSILTSGSDYPLTNLLNKYPLSGHLQCSRHSAAFGYKTEKETLQKKGELAST